MSNPSLIAVRISGSMPVSSPLRMASMSAPRTPTSLPTSVGSQRCLKNSSSQSRSANCSSMASIHSSGQRRNFASRPGGILPVALPSPYRPSSKVFSAVGPKLTQGCRATSVWTNLQSLKICLRYFGSLRGATVSPKGRRKGVAKPATGRRASDSANCFSQTQSGRIVCQNDAPCQPKTYTVGRFRKVAEKGGY